MEQLNKHELNPFTAIHDKMLSVCHLQIVKGVACLKSNESNCVDVVNAFM